MKPPTVVELTWTRELEFAARAGEIELTIDSDGKSGASPMQSVALGLAGCMAVDLVHILRKGRHDLRGLRARLTGRRAEQEPRRFVEIDLHYEIEGAVSESVVQRAIDLSRDKYCSVWHSLRQDIVLTVTFDISPAAG